MACFWRWMRAIKHYGKKVRKVIKVLTLREQLLEEMRRNEALRALVKEQEDALVELAEIVAVNEEAINNG